MLKKRGRPVQSQSRDQLMTDPTSDSCFSSSDSVASKAGIASFFSVPGLFVGKGSSPDCDSARSPTSPLELRAFPFSRSPRSPGGHSPRSWECSRVGLGLVDSLKDETLSLSECKNILFGSQMRINTPSPQSQFDALSPKSLPKDYGISSQTLAESPYRRSGCSKLGLGSNSAEFEPGREFGKIRSCSADIDTSSSSLPLFRLMYQNIKSSPEVFASDAKGSNFDNFSSSLPKSVIGPLSASEIELSEDYTCIICHGPNPKTTHIFGDCILESHEFESLEHKNKNEEVGGGSSWLVNCVAEDVPPHPSHDFLSFCFSCKKKLGEGEDIYIYRGEKAFCSHDCRDQEILIEEQMEKNPTTDSAASFFEEEIFL